MFQLVVTRVKSAVPKHVTNSKPGIRKEGSSKHHISGYRAEVKGRQQTQPSTLAAAKKSLDFIRPTQIFKAQGSAMISSVKRGCYATVEFLQNLLQNIKYLSTLVAVE